jgi:uncharacterized membrane protein
MKLSDVSKEDNMRDKYRKVFRYARLIVKPVGFVFAFVGIIMFVVEVLGSVGSTMGKGGLIMLVVGAALWLLDTLWDTADDWDELRKEKK